MKRLRSFPLLLLCLVLLRPPAAWAWGTEAHRVIASIAEARLSPAARAGVASLLHGDTLASISMWADEMRANHPDTVRWHHVMIPLDADRYVAGRDCRPSAQRVIVSSPHCSDRPRRCAIRMRRGSPGWRR